MTLDALFSLIAPRQYLAIAIGLSIVFYAFASNISLERLASLSGPFQRSYDWSRRSRVALVLFELTRWVYYLVLPYLTLLLGLDTVRALGVWNLDWFESPTSLYYAGAITVGSIFVFIWVWRPYARTEHPHAVDESRWNWARHILELIYQQAHWAFYRSGPILWLSDHYWGSFIGLALVIIEAWSNPRVRSNVHSVTRADAPLWTTSLAVVSTIVFVFTQNSWYALALHLLLDLGLRNIIGFPKVAELVDESPVTYQAITDAPE